MKEKETQSKGYESVQAGRQAGEREAQNPADKSYLLWRQGLKYSV